MSPPEIFTTGSSRNPIRYKALPGEPDETIRAAVRNKTIIASIRVDMDDLGYAKGSLEELGMGEENARAIVEAASDGIAGVGVRFETVFLQEGRIGGPREYRNFELFEPQETT